MAISAEYGLGDTPVFVRAGAVVPTRTMRSAYHTTADPLVWMVAAGAAAGQGEVYEDDGESLGFKVGEGAVTTLRLLTAHNQLRATVSASNGTFAGMASSRAHWWSCTAWGRCTAQLRDATARLCNTPPRGWLWRGEGGGRSRERAHPGLGVRGDCMRQHANDGGPRRHGDVVAPKDSSGWWAGAFRFRFCARNVFKAHDCAGTPVAHSGVAHTEFLPATCRACRSRRACAVKCLAGLTFDTRPIDLRVVR